MRQEKANYSIKRMARLLKVSRSGYYKWAHVQQKRLSGKDDRSAFYDDVDRKIHQIWKDSDEVYGAPRITAELAERYRISLNRKTVAKRMRMMGIEGISPRAFVSVTTIQSKRKSTLPDLVKRMFDTGELNRVWMSDITYLRTSEGWLYLCAVRDGHSRRVLGWAMDSVQDTHLVERALRMAHTLRGDVPDGLVFHADRGTQFTSEKLWEVCRNLGIAQSVGRTGVCFDNAMAESFWSTLKTEFYDRKRWPTRDAARKAVAYWIEVVYNGPDPRKVDTSGVSYAALVSVADVSASKSSGARRLHQECRLRVLYRMHHRKTSCRQTMGLSKTFRSRRTSRFKAALKDSARALSALVPTAPMDWRTPSQAQWSLNACEVYTLP
ncbi:hypothetical protein BBR43_08750 [Corynebacterium striatum]|nr:hypothetical protein BBR43_08750 [Corynebacterium striatum]